MYRGMLYTAFLLTAAVLIACGVEAGFAAAAADESLQAADASTQPAWHPDMRRPGRGGGGRQGMPPDDLLQGRRPRRHDGARRPGRPPVELSPEQREQLLAFVAKHFPFLHERLSDEAAADRPAAGRLIRRLWPLYETCQRDPELGGLLVAEHKLEFRIRQAVRRYGGTDDEAARHDLRNELEKLLREQFDVQTDRRALELRELEARLTEHKSRLEHRRQVREQTVLRRLAELTEAAGSGRRPVRHGDKGLWRGPPRLGPPTPGEP